MGREGGDGFAVSCPADLVKLCEPVKKENHPPRLHGVSPLEVLKSLGGCGGVSYAPLATTIISYGII